MHLNKTTKYAIRILSYIARYEDKKLLTAKELSEVLDISYKFLTKIMTALVKAGFIISVRGREGGYHLCKPAEETSILDILNHFNELAEFSHCILGIGSCNVKKKCILHDEWIKPKELIKKMFEETTLKSLEGKGLNLRDNLLVDKT